MGRSDYLDLGNWNAVCFECGRKRKASQMKKHWRGYYVCPEHWESREQQDFVRSVPDNMTVPWTQPMPVDVLTLTDLLLTESSNEFTGDFIYLLAEDAQPLITET